MTFLNTEYQQNFENWVSQQITLLKMGRVHELDVEHLIGELEGMARRDRNELISDLIILIAHLLKWQFQLSQLTETWEQFSGKSWRNSILERRYCVHEQLENTPSLQNCLPEAVMKAYPKAVALAVDETGLSKAIFPPTCPYSIAQLLDKAFYPPSCATGT
jgi:hypothetical protein